MGFESKFEDCTVVLEPLSKNTFLLLVSVDPRVGTSTLPTILMHQALMRLFLMLPRRDGSVAIQHTAMPSTYSGICRCAVGVGEKMRVSISSCLQAMLHN